MAEQDLQDLEQAAKYRPGAVSQIANLLTGGLYGMASGATQKSADAERARQALFQENLSNRLMQRRRMESLLDQAADFGIPKQEAQKLVSEDPALLANRMNQIKMRQTLSQETGRQMGLAGEQGPIQTQTPMEGQAFSLGQLSGQAERFKEERDLDEATKTATALGIPVPQGATSSAITALIAREQAKSSQRESFNLSNKQKAENARAFLRANNKPVPENDSDAIASADLVEKKLPSAAALERDSRINAFYDAVKSGVDQDAIRRAYDNLPSDAKRDPDIQDRAGINPMIPPEVRKEIPVIMKQYEEAGVAAQAIATLVGSKDYRTVSKDSFNELTYKLNKQKDKFFKSDEERDAINEVVTSFKTLVSSQRKVLFGASLTASEFEEAKDLWAQKDSADFLPRALRFIDRIHSKARIKEMSERYSGVPKNAVEQESKYLKEYDNVISNIKGFRSKARRLQAPAPADQSGGTNAPAGTRVLNFDNKGNLIQ